ncbi:hypothetical protein JNX00_04235 [Hydrogenophaga sp. YM1]|uniref:hypothetical protein n=1 Tax=Hydrogenophaga sp. YM1 TaxID=2806262 RepID=UPI001959A616|nr:hypothetical protein [Hydrogenophaga sp. YM1]QRR35093.1 hypothetical protein JNX00_04235 [Hydrogenophaga sp. YM1]
MQHHPHPDPEVAALVEQCAARLAQAGERIGDWVRAATAGQARPVLPAHGPAEAARLLTTATRLCDEGAFDQALRPALVLVMQHPGRAAFAFLAGTCLQRTARPAAALPMFGLAGLQDGNRYAALAAFRSGECLAAMGRADDAIAVFDAAVEACRQRPALAELQRLAQDKAEALRATG